MAEDGKKPITVDTTIDMFAETRSKSAPDWLSARPKAAKLAYQIPVKRTLELDPRKWKKSTLTDGVYAVARYELKVFATALAAIDKEVEKAFPKGKKIPKNAKDETKEEAAALDKAADKIAKLQKKYFKEIRDKVSLALDEVQSDKGDNKKAIAAGKEAIKRFENLDTKGMFARPTGDVAKAMIKLSQDLEKAPGEAAFKVALRSLDAVQKDFDATARTTQNVVKFLQDMGAKMAKDKNADPGLQKIGKDISTTGPLKTALSRLSDAVDDFGSALADTTAELKGVKTTPDQARAWAARFIKDHGTKDKSVTDSVKAVKVISQKFNKTVKSVKA